MNGEDRLKLAQAWMAHAREFRQTEEKGEYWWAAEKLWDLEQEDPETLWLVILLIHSLNEELEDTVIIENLSAGPLEMLLAKHGPKFIDRVEAEARRDPKFAFLLCGVWQNMMSDEIWTRVLNAQNQNGWESILQRLTKTH